MADEKKAAEIKEEKPKAGHTFTHTQVDKAGKKVTKKYKTTVAKMIIPHLNEGKPLTSLEVSTDEDAIKHLVESKSQVIEEIPGEVETPNDPKDPE